MMAAAQRPARGARLGRYASSSPPMFLLLQLTESCGACVPHILWRYVPKIFQPTGHVAKETISQRVRCETCGTHDDAFRFRIKIHVICPGSFEGGAGCVESSAFLFRFCHRAACTPDGFTRGGDLVVVVRFNFRPLLSAAVFSLGCLKLGRSHIGKIRHRWRFGRAD